MNHTEHVKQSSVSASGEISTPRVVIERNAPRLGKVVARRLIQWLAEHPDGVISLPTGKTPAYFIKYLQWYRQHWQAKEVQTELEQLDLPRASFPDMRGITFVQMDEFLPIEPERHTSFARYIRQQYIPALQLDESRALLMIPHEKQSIEEFCGWYEDQISRLGGIGFFLGGIGPDGHVAFNMRGSDALSRTRVVTLNYESAAAAAVSFGGMQHVRGRQAVTIGMRTIMKRDDATIIVMAAGEAKAQVMAQAIEHAPSAQCPASLLRAHTGTMFYVTDGAAKHLSTTRLQKKIEQGMRLIHHKTIVHTAPHHDDVMLSYYSLAQRLCREKSNRNYFAYITSGFNSVTHEYLTQLFRDVEQAFIAQHAEIIFASTRYGAIEKFCQAYRSGDQDVIRTWEQCIGLYNMRVVFECATVYELEQTCTWLLKTYIPTCRPGQKDVREVGVLKGMMRESECERMWELNGVPRDRVWHMRASFYTGEKKEQSDEEQLAAYFDAVQPDIITVALDPEGTGPDTHFKTLVLVRNALKRARYVSDNVEIWGYRNVWHRFDFDEATMIVPVTQQEMEEMHQVFMSCFSTQKRAEFPPIYFDGPFSSYAQQIQREQWRDLQKRCAVDIDADGCILLKQLSRDELEREIACMGYDQ